ncbi:MAG: fibronectin type III domain-containing protein [Ruminococcus sp.]|nr:fibronectin type III domain-containing protein [Ruminococcus sp.]
MGVRTAAAVAAAGFLFGGLTSGTDAVPKKDSKDDRAAYEAQQLIAPKILRYIASKDSIRVYWSAVDNADGYKLYRKRPSGGWAELGTFGRKERAFLRTGLKNGTKYTFKVCAFIKRDGREYLSDDSPEFVTYTKENERDAVNEYRRTAEEAGEDAVFGLADLNGDGMPEMIVRKSDEQYPCTLYSYYKGELYEPLSEFDRLYKYYPGSYVISDMTDTGTAEDFRYLYMPPHGHSVMLGVKTFYKKKYGGEKKYAFKKYYMTASQFGAALDMYTGGADGRRFNNSFEPVWHSNTEENRQRFIDFG